MHLQFVRAESAPCSQVLEVLKWWLWHTRMMSRNTIFDYSWRMTSCQDSFSASWKLRKFKFFKNIQNFRDFGKIIKFSQSLASFFPSLLIKFIFINSVNFMNIRRHFKNFCPITKISFSIFPRWWHQSLLWSCDKVFFWKQKPKPIIYYVFWKANPAT